MNRSCNKWIGKVQLENQEGINEKISIVIHNEIYGDNERNSFLFLKEHYNNISAQAYRRLFEFIVNLRKRNDERNDYCQSVPVVDNLDLMKEMVFLYSIEIFNFGKIIRLFYEFGYHSEYILTVSLTDGNIDNISFG
ncbi:MAG: hypothetical protein D3923_18600 [Candidatus Electrothrix sp. AR3]|nr:hypothetical protein [Candidatus Electrothrix sp. AR3]